MSNSRQTFAGRVESWLDALGPGAIGWWFEVAASAALLLLSLLWDFPALFFWTAVAVASVFAAVAAVRHVRRRGVEFRRRNNLCLRCGYDLRASTDRCPECGTPVARGDVYSDLIRIRSGPS